MRRVFNISFTLIPKRLEDLTTISLGFFAYITSNITLLYITLTVEEKNRIKSI